VGAVEDELSHRGRFVLHVGPVGGHRLAYLFIGAWTLDGSHVGLWVESNPKYGPQRRRILDAANANGLPGRWLRRLDTWKALTTELEPTESLAQSALVAWYADRLAELEAAGILDLLPVLSKGLVAGPAVAAEVDGMTP
jgi:hypothetical protein